MTDIRSQRVAIVDYGLANIQSVHNALACFGVDARVATKGDDLTDADRIVLPGVGHFDEGMRGLRSRGHADALDALVRRGGKPMLAICLGFQFLFADSEEGREPGLGWIGTRIRRLPVGPEVKVPHMGWSEVEIAPGSRLMAGLVQPAEFYFVHSYCAPSLADTEARPSATCVYGAPFVAALEMGNVFATQFHPEKSQLTGMKLLETFLRL